MKKTHPKNIQKLKDLATELYLLSHGSNEEVTQKLPRIEQKIYELSTSVEKTIASS